MLQYARTSPAAKSGGQSSRHQDNHRHYLAICFLRTHFKWSSNPAPRFHDFWLFGRHCSPLLPGRPPLRTASTRKQRRLAAHSEGWGGVGSNLLPPGVWRFQIPRFILSKSIAKAAVFSPPSRNRGRKWAKPPWNTHGCSPTPTPPQSPEQQRPLRHLQRAPRAKRSPAAAA